MQIAVMSVRRSTAASSETPKKCLTKVEERVRYHCSDFFSQKFFHSIRMLIRSAKKVQTPTVAIKKTRHLVNLPYKPGISN